MQELERNAKGGGDPRLWNPPFCGDIDLEIRRDGSWWYLGTAIARFELQCLFAGILRRENNDYFLVTPVEKVRIRVADAPFIVTACEIQNDQIILFNNVAETICLGPAHPLLIEGDKESPRPYVEWRDGLRARLSSAVYYELCEYALQQPSQNGCYGVLSQGQFFALSQPE